MKRWPCRSLLSLFLVMPLLAACGGNGSSSTGSVSEGQTLAQNNCRSCHDPGDNSYSGTTASIVDGGAVFAPNLTPDNDTGVGGWSDAQLFNAIKKGVDDQGQTLCAIMPRWGSTMSDGEINDIIAFLRTLTAVSKQVPDSTCD